MFTVSRPTVESPKPSMPSYERDGAGHLIASYGASATSTVLLKLLGIEKYVSFIIDDNLDRQGRLSPGDLIPVYPRSYLIRNPR